MNALYEGSVRHRRFAVRERDFRYRVALAYLDLDDLPAKLLRRGPGLVRWRRGDYFGDPSVPLAQTVRDLVEQRTGTRPAGRVQQLTQPRTLGHCFNPVSFYYCHDADDRLTAVVAEVTNTPWGERHAYVIEGSGAVIRGSSAKQMHVSPFMAMDQSYAWNVAEPRETLSVHIENHRRDQKVFDATLALQRRELSTAALVRRYPLGVLARIYMQALRLKLRGVPVHPHPGAST